MVELPKCVCNASESFKKQNQLMKLMQFLMGLDDSYMQIRSSIFSREVLPVVRSSYATISSEESHRGALNLNSRPRSNNLNNNNKKGGGSGLVYKNCGFNGHIIDGCFKIIGYHADFEKKKSGQNFKGKNISNNNSIGTSSSSGFTDEQVTTLLSLIKDNKIRKNVHVNMVDINHVKFFDIEYPQLPNDDERVEPRLNSDQKSQSACSNSFVPNEDVNIADFPANNSRNDDDSSKDIFAAKNEGVTKLKKMYFLRVIWILIQVLLLEEEIDYEETFSLVVKMVTVRCLLNVAISNSWHVFQLNVNNAFLYCDLVETVYMKPPEGYFLSGNKVCRLTKSLYGLKKAPRLWNAKLTSTLIENSFSQSKSDYSLYTKSDKGVFLALHLGKLKYFLGIDVIDTDKGIYLNQMKYVIDLLYEYGMLACKPAKTPLVSKLVISNEATENDHILDSITDYQLMGKLIYLTNTRPDISYDVHCLGEPSSLFDFEEVMNNNHNQESPPQNGPPPMVRPNRQAPRTMEELCQPSINGRGGLTAPIPIQATYFGLRHHMIQQDTSAIRDETSRNISFTSTTESLEVVRQLKMMNKNFSETTRQFQTVKAVNMKCETCGGLHSFTECPAVGGYTQETAYATTGSLPSKTVPNPRADLKATTIQSGVTLAGPSVFPPLPSNEVDREQETITNQVTKDTVQPSTKNIQPPVVQTQVPIDELVVAQKLKPAIPYPSRSNKQKLREKDDMPALKFLKIFKNLHFELSFADALLHVPKFALIFKSLLNNKEKLFDLATTPMNENCSTVILKKLPEKIGDPDKFLIQCDW
uniref:Ribonuclease H-like domain-containing protein n=1 Tax=Tanacetum cinerariifolium TaxID=118510 RepID=A0A6L2J7J2_TANCI|nr:ribonuclease H-like domain-containing protein [Tanacetum cinerariifolium]